MAAHTPWPPLPPPRPTSPGEGGRDAEIPPPWAGGGWERGEVRRRAPTSGTTLSVEGLWPFVAPPSWPPPCSNPPPPRGEETAALPTIIRLCVPPLPGRGAEVAGEGARG